MLANGKGDEPPSEPEQGDDGKGCARAEEELDAKQDSVDDTLDEDDGEEDVLQLNAESEPGNNPIDDLLFEGVQGKDIEERLAWHTNAPLLYDIFLGCTLEWPALSISWLPDEPNENCRLVFGSHTDGSANNEVVIAELSCAADRTIEANPWRQWQLDGLGDTEGFGFSAADGSSPLCPVVRINHPTEVNRVAPCPHRGQLIATKAATGDVHLFNYKAERSETDFSPDVTLHSPGGNVDGFALCWCPLEKTSLASGSNDGRLPHCLLRGHGHQ